MKTLNKIFGAALVTSLLFSCNDDFLETEPTEFVSSSQISDYSDVNPDLQAANIKGIYTMMVDTGTGGTDLRHTDFGQKAYDIFSDIVSGDMILGGLNYGWYSGIANLSATTDYTDVDNYQPWRYYYRIIFSANLIIDQLGGNDQVPEDDSAKIYYAQAKFFRGMSYFYLMNLFTEGYTPGGEGLPYYDEPSDAQPSINQTDLYNNLIADLEQATNLLAGFDRQGVKNEVNQDVAESYLAYAYAAIGEDGLAATHSGNVIARGNHTIMTEEEVLRADRTDDGNDNPTGGGFNDVNTPGWIWGFDITTDQGLDLVSWWGQVDIFTYSYASVGDPKTINKELLDGMPADDIRKSQFVGNYFGNNQQVPTNKFFDPGRAIQGQRNITTDYVYLRIAEMYLLNAEASAKSGDEPTAKTSLKALVELRVPDATYIDALSGQPLLDEIYVQTRRELWGEGKSYLAMKRNQATVKYPTNHLTNAGETYPYNADELTFEIPIEEIQNNPNLE